MHLNVVNYKPHIFKLKRLVADIKIRCKSTFLTVDFRFARASITKSPYDHNILPQTEDEQVKGLDLLIPPRIWGIFNVIRCDKCPSL